MNFWDLVPLISELVTLHVKGPLRVRLSKNGTYYFPLKIKVSNPIDYGHDILDSLNFCYIVLCDVLTPCKAAKVAEQLFQKRIQTLFKMSECHFYSSLLLIPAYVKRTCDQMDCYFLAVEMLFLILMDV